MASMSYCRFENTAIEIQNCIYDLEEAIENGLNFDQFMKNLSSDYERNAVRRIANLLNCMKDAFEQLKNNEGLSDEKFEGSSSD